MVVAAQLLEKVMPKMPNGGTVKITETLLTIIVILFVKIYKVKKATVLSIATVGVSLTIFTFTGLFEYMIFPWGYLLDYAIPFLLVLIVIPVANKSVIKIGICSVVIFLLMLVSVTISGVVVWEIALIPSLIYNSSYMIPSIVISPFVIAFTIKGMEHSIKTISHKFNN